MIRSFCLLLVISSLVLGQTRDTMRVSFEQFIQSFDANSPQTAQLSSLIDIARASVLQARGAFDPMFKTSTDEKFFADKLYYEYPHAEVSVPTIIGLKFNAGYEDADGIFIAQDRTTPAPGLWFAGAELDVGAAIFWQADRLYLR